MAQRENTSPNQDNTGEASSGVGRNHPDPEGDSTHHKDRKEMRNDSDLVVNTSEQKPSAEKQNFELFEIDKKIS